MNNGISKTQYVSGSRCIKKLWLERNNPNFKTSLSMYQKLVISRGNQVGEVARSFFPGGKLIENDQNSLNKAIEKTKEELKNGTKYIYEATFSYNNVLIRIDILEKVQHGKYNIYEVKSSTSVKDEYLTDVAIQEYVLTKSGINVNSVSIILINNKYIYRKKLDIKKLFKIQKITPSMKLELQKVDNNLVFIEKALMENNEPSIKIGKQCLKPRDCEFKTYCWPVLNENSIFDIPRLNIDTKFKLFHSGIIQASQIPESIKVTENQRKYLKVIKSKECSIDNNFIRSEISKLVFPIHFLDFETIQYPIPIYENSYPFEQIPFQFSCHILEDDGRIKHHEYIHSKNSDPRLNLLEKLLNSINIRKGSIVVHHASMEKGVLSSLANTHKQYETILNAFIMRIWDQETIFKNYYIHPGFRGSASMKYIIPTLFPESSYDGLEIGSGLEAMAQYIELLKMNPESVEFKELKAHLLEYCKLDTFGMVKIFWHLQELIKTGN